MTEIGNSPISAATAGGVRQATNFKVVVTIDGEIPDVRPGFTCTADITTAERENAVSVPIQALTVRELTFDPQGKAVKAPKPEGQAAARPLDAGRRGRRAQARLHKKEVEGVFVVDKDNRAEFVQVKTGVAGDKYFEVLEGLKAGDRVITGPFASVRNISDGTQVKVEATRRPKWRPAEAGGRRPFMYQVFESLKIALAAIWANKLRSFLTVLGNIVAVTSIIAVVSLVQGIDDYVSDAIVSDLGVGTFQVQRFGMIRSEEEFEKVAGNPLITEKDAAAVRKASLVKSVMTQANSSAEVRYKDRSIESVSVYSVSRDYAEFGGYKIERGRLVTPMEIDRKRPVAIIGWDVADKLFPDEDPLDKVISVAGSHVRVVGVNEKKGSIFGNSQDQFALIPIGLGAKLFGARQRIEVTAKPADPRETDRRWKRRRWNCASSAA